MRFKECTGCESSLMFRNNKKFPSTVINIQHAPLISPPVMNVKLKNKLMCSSIIFWKGSVEVRQRPIVSGDHIQHSM